MGSVTNISYGMTNILWIDFWCKMQIDKDFLPPDEYIRHPSLARVKSKSELGGFWRLEPLEELGAPLPTTAPEPLVCFRTTGESPRGDHLGRFWATSCHLTNTSPLFGQNIIFLLYLVTFQCCQTGGIKSLFLFGANLRFWAAAAWWRPEVVYFGKYILKIGAEYISVFVFCIFVFLYFGKYILTIWAVFVFLFWRGFLQRFRCGPNGLGNLSNTSQELQKCHS